MTKSDAIIDIKTKIQVANLSVSVYEPFVKENTSIYYSNMLNDVKRDIAMVTERINTFVDNVNPTDVSVAAFHRSQNHVLSRIESRITIIKNACKEQQAVELELSNRYQDIKDSFDELKVSSDKRSSNVATLGMAVSVGVAAIALYRLITR